MSQEARLFARKLGAWPWPETPDYERLASHRFKAQWSVTAYELRREMGLLGATQGVLEIDLINERDVRRDGFTYEGARVKSPRVVLRFSVDLGAAYAYHCDRYDHWQANVRAIRLGLEALRAVDRYGIAGHGEQFAGFRELPSTTGPTMTTTRAAEVIAGSSERAAIQKVLDDADAAKGAARVAVKKAHPDAGGTNEQFHVVQTARKVLTAHHGQAI